MMNRENNLPTQPLYVPVTITTHLQYSPLKRTIPLAAFHSPDRICGKAFRVGYVLGTGEKQALYRLRLSHVGRTGATLPGFFLIVDGVFVPYVSSTSVM